MRSLDPGEEGGAGKEGPWGPKKGIRDPGGRRKGEGQEDQTPARPPQGSLETIALSQEKAPPPAPSTEHRGEGLRAGSPPPGPPKPPPLPAPLPWRWSS